MVTEEEEDDDDEQQQQQQQQACVSSCMSTVDWAGVHEAKGMSSPQQTLHAR